MVQQDFLLKKPSQGQKSNIHFDSLSNNVTGLGARLRVMEERYSNVRKKIQMTDQNLLDFEKDIRGEIRSLNQELMDVKRGLNEINDNILRMSSELQKCVQQSDFRVIEKYVDMWQPMNFVTKKELNRYLKEKDLYKD